MEVGYEPSTDFVGGIAKSCPHFNRNHRQNHIRHRMPNPASARLKPEGESPKPVNPSSPIISTLNCCCAVPKTSGPGVALAPYDRSTQRKGERERRKSNDEPNHKD